MEEVRRMVKNKMVRLSKPTQRGMNSDVIIFAVFEGAARRSIPGSQSRTVDVRN